MARHIFTSKYHNNLSANIQPSKKNDNKNIYFHPTRTSTSVPACTCSSGKKCRNKNQHDTSFLSIRKENAICQYFSRSTEPKNRLFISLFFIFTFYENQYSPIFHISTSTHSGSFGGLCFQNQTQFESSQL